MLTKLWTVGIKVPHLERELAFQRGLGNTVVLDETFDFEGSPYRMALIKAGDKYLHITEKTVYERTFPSPQAHGLVHLVYVTDNIEADVERAIQSGATCFIGLSEINASFGRRRVAFLHSPSGYVFELIEILENRVPPV
jgi:hypothetical protein